MRHGPLPDAVKEAFANDLVDVLPGKLMIRQEQNDMLAFEHRAKQDFEAAKRDFTAFIERAEAEGRFEAQTRAARRWN